MVMGLCQSEDGILWATTAGAQDTRTDSRLEQQLSPHLPDAEADTGTQGHVSGGRGDASRRQNR